MTILNLSLSSFKFFFHNSRDTSMRDDWSLLTSLGYVCRLCSSGTTASDFCSHSLTAWKSKFLTLHKRCPYSEFFWSVFPSIFTEYGEIYSVQMWKRTDQKNSEYRHFPRSVIHNCNIKISIFLQKTLTCWFINILILQLSALLCYFYFNTVILSV